MVCPYAARHATALDTKHGDWTDTILTIMGASGTALVMLLNNGSLTLPAH